MIEKTVHFTEPDVELWNITHQNTNILHDNEQAAADSTFGQRVVPNMMLMAELQSMVSEFADEGETAILSGITAARFRDPILFGEIVNITMEVVEETKKFTAIDFNCRTKKRDSLVANGTLNIVVNSTW